MTPADRPEVLILISLMEPWHDELAREFTIRYVARAADRVAALRAHGSSIRAIITNSTAGTDRALIDALPRLEIIALFSAGYEGIDLAAARERRIPVTNAPGGNAGAVADLAIGLALAAFRQIPRRDRELRAGRWDQIRSLTSTLTGKRLGLIGLGHVAKAIARRAAAFEMAIAYTKPAPDPTSPYRYIDTVEALARESDLLVVACPGGTATRHLVNARVLAALGPSGYLVNVSRGSVVDTAALIDALEQRTIAGAGLDVYENEPQVPERLRSLENAVLMPHTAGFTHESFRASFEIVRENLRAQFAGRPLLTPIGGAR